MLDCLCYLSADCNLCVAWYKFREHCVCVLLKPLRGFQDAVFKLYFAMNRSFNNTDLCIRIMVSWGSIPAFGFTLN